MRDPQLFFRGCSKPVVIFDEIHQLRDPARVLKIGADGFPKLKILATGSSRIVSFTDADLWKKPVSIGDCVHF